VEEAVDFVAFKGVSMVTVAAASALPAQRLEGLQAYRPPVAMTTPGTTGLAPCPGNCVATVAAAERDNFLHEPRVDTSTKKQLAKAVRALRHVVLRRTANFNPLFGASSRPLSMVVLLSKHADRAKLKSFRIQLPHPMFEQRLTEGSFIKTGGQRKLQVQFGWASMEEERLLKNALVVLEAVRKSFDKGIIRDISLLEMDGLALPVWDPGIDKKRKKRARTHSMQAAPMQTSMGPPHQIPSKRLKTGLQAAGPEST